MTERALGLTEGRHPLADGLERLPVDQLVARIGAVDREVLPAVEAAHAQIARAAGMVEHALRAGGRVLYVGAGTSGRLGALDAAECPPTFGSAPEQVQFAIAGGEGALVRAVERAEDDPAAGAREVASRTRPGDVVIGIAASGRTPFVQGALSAGRTGDRRTVLITCNPDVASDAELVIRLLVGPEIVSGSTRMKAGTATKLTLNMISTAAMIRLGKVYHGRMVDLRATNAKLAERAQRIVVELGRCDPERARALLAATDGAVGPAIVMARRAVDRAAAEALLAAAAGRIAEILDGD